jgi:hypothetical protein
MFIKKVFLYFEPICADLASNFAEFYADFKTVEKVAKKDAQKVIDKM